LSKGYRRMGKIISIIEKAMPGWLYTRSVKIKSTFIDFLLQIDHAFIFPRCIHFLMNNYCNARCVFCNQRFEPSQKSEISLDLFQRMIKHIPLRTTREVYFSGGGEPLLAKDLIDIISHLNTHAPWVRVYIKTNGILLGAYADALARLKIYQIEISIHGLEKTNNQILQKEVTKEIIEGIKVFRQRLAYYKNPIRLAFCAAVSGLNIEEIPAMIIKASELGIDQFSVEFTKYFLHALNREKAKLSAGDSLFFHQQLYDKTIEKSKLLAESLGIRFLSHPLFGQPFAASACSQPWSTLLVDWQGNVYPCTGGEVWFKDQVGSGKYYFGNLLKDDLRSFWNNSFYRKLRRTCSRLYKEKLISECNNCHMGICLRGPNYQDGHILEAHA
jgi:radical SAM protein with 4Fe4S-binding SPASM domain